MKNTMADLHNHLFAQIERLGDEDLTAEQINAETKRAHAMVSVADQIIEGQKLNLTAAKLFAEHGEKILPMLPPVGKALPAKPEGDSE
jgi:hypothetical protein